MAAGATVDQPVQASGGPGAQQVEDEVFTGRQHERGDRDAGPAGAAQSPGQLVNIGWGLAGALARYWAVKLSAETLSLGAICQY